MLGRSRLALSLIRRRQAGLEPDRVGVLCSALPTSAACGLRRHFSSPAQEAVVFSASEAVRPGDTVQLALASRASVVVSCGDHEEVELQVSTSAGSEAAALNIELSRSEANSEGHSRLTFREEPSPEARRQQRAGSNLAARSVRVRAPARFVSWDIHSAGGDVFVESLKEASLEVESGGGSITVPSLKGNHAALWSMGGAISGSVTAASVEIRSRGGAVQMKSLVGKAVAVDTLGGPLRVGACYADQVALRSGGAPLILGTLQCSSGEVDSQGGAISVDSFQGSAELRSGGGEIQVHVQPDAQRLQLSSAGGAVTLLLPHDAPARLRFPAGTRVSLPAGSQGSEQTQASDGTLQVLLRPAASGSGSSSGSGSNAPLSRLQAAAAAQGGLAGQPCPAIVLQPGCGAVVVQQLSWVEAMQAKLRQT